MRSLVAEEMEADIDCLDRPGSLLAEFFGGPGLAAVERAADAAELGERLLAQLSEVALRDGRCLVATQAAEYLDAAPVVRASPGRVGQNDATCVAGERPA